MRISGPPDANISENSPVIENQTNENDEISNARTFSIECDGNFSKEIPLLTRLVNKLPNIETDVPSNLSLRGEVAYLMPGAPKGNNFNGEATSYIDDFEASSIGIDIRNSGSWFHSSIPLDPELFPESDETLTIYSDSTSKNGNLMKFVGSVVWKNFSIYTLFK